MESGGSWLGRDVIATVLTRIELPLGRTAISYNERTRRSVIFLLAFRSLILLFPASPLAFDIPPLCSMKRVALQTDTATKRKCTDKRKKERNKGNPEWDEWRRVASRRVVSCRVVSSRRVGEMRWIRIEEVMCKLAMLEFLSSDFSSSHPPIERTSLFWR